jgi:SagB-type dehydrogenase family enzyme
MIARETLSLAPGVSLTPTADGRRALTSRFPLTLPPVSLSVSAALDALCEGAHSADELTELAGRDGLTHAAIFHSLLETLRVHWALARTLHLDGHLVARLYPETVQAARTLPRADTRYRLSRFAFTHGVESGLSLHVPMSPPTLWMGSWHGPALLGALATPRLPAELAQAVPGIPEETAAAFLLMLMEVGALVVVNPEGTAIEPERLATWEFHDLMFHSWTRWGVQEKGYGGATYRFRGQLPQPGRKPRPSGEALPLEKPDIAALEQKDPPFTAVLERRRTMRHQGEQPITRAQLGELLYRAVGLRHADLEGRDQKEARPYPAGGALYENEVYVLVHRCEGLPPGLYAYWLEDHTLYPVPAPKEELETLLQLATQSMNFQKRPQVVLVLTARFARMAWKYETMAYAVMLKHVGVIFQTLYLVATAMGLAPCALGNGGADLFARAAGLDPLVEGSVGEFVIGSRPD